MQLAGSWLPDCELPMNVVDQGLVKHTNIQDRHCDDMEHSTSVIVLLDLPPDKLGPNISRLVRLVTSDAWLKGQAGSCLTAVCNRFPVVRLLTVGPGSLCLVWHWYQVAAVSGNFNNKGSRLFMRKSLRFRLQDIRQKTRKYCLHKM